MANNAIEFKNITKIYKLFKNDKKRFLATFNKRIKYKEKLAINNISFSVEKGEAVALLGRNGAGKSTVLKIITGVSHPTEGEVKVDGIVGALLELTTGFDPEFTGRENIYLKGQLMGMTNNEIEEVEDDIVDFADVGEYIDQPLRTYSSGMKARLGFAINVCVKPDILIVDEALSVGDAKFSAKCKEKVNEMISDYGTTFLLVTHSAEMAKKFCDRGIVLKNGSVIFDGEIQDAITVYNEALNTEDAPVVYRETSEHNNRIRSFGGITVAQLLLVVIELSIFVISIGLIYAFLFM